MALVFRDSRTVDPRGYRLTTRRRSVATFCSPGDFRRNSLPEGG